MMELSVYAPPNQLQRKDLGHMGEAMLLREPQLVLATRVVTHPLTEPIQRLFSEEMIQRLQLFALRLKKCGNKFCARPGKRLRR